MASTPPGWYDDERGALRWWDGTQWTEHVQTPDPGPEGSDATEAPDPLDPQAPAQADDTVAPPAPAAPQRSAESAWTVDPDETTGPTGDPVVGSAPPGYPGGFPGGTAPTGAFIAATEPKKSRLWILWVVLGVVLLGFVILAVVLIPMLFGLISGASNGSNSQDEAAAVAAVELYDEAWQSGDCAKWEQATTEALREALQLADCAAFEQASAGFVESVQEYNLEITSVSSDENSITVETAESYLSFFDADGNETTEAQPYQDNYAYVVVPTDSGWAIDEAINVG